ncbi:MAG TPA: hypothetical protein VEH31_12210, partial [Streptosporangiaceae bacterium]|nr:hypothetical protein [Streptosporangiaceae bacterium]
MTMYSGAGLLSQFVEREVVTRLRLLCELARGHATPSGAVTAPLSGARRVAGLRCRCQRAGARRG